MYLIRPHHCPKKESVPNPVGQVARYPPCLCTLSTFATYPAVLTRPSRRDQFVVCALNHLHHPACANCSPCLLLSSNVCAQTRLDVQSWPCRQHIHNNRVTAKARILGSQMSCPILAVCFQLNDYYARPIYRALATEYMTIIFHSQFKSWGIIPRGARSPNRNAYAKS